MAAHKLVACTALLGLLALADALSVRQCPGKSIANLENNVDVVGCNKTPCRLIKGKDQYVNLKFVPENNYKNIKNHVTADLGLGIPVPFVGVDGNSICDKLYSEDGQKESCPVTAGRTYVYKDSFPVYEVYPELEVTVHWAIQSNEHDLTCFELPARIKNKKS
uniref:Niemann Pick type C n=1 Tax=Histia rhodope TaxID=1453155 RepID=A0A6M3YCC9_9NEOP|nr:Niemann Pick type C [Histia rhodope]